MSEPSTCGRSAARKWQGEPGTHVIESYPVDEFCMVIAGEVTLTDRAGRTRTFRPGIGFVLPRGFAGTWHMPVRSGKYFASFRDPGMIAYLMGKARK